MGEIKHTATPWSALGDAIFHGGGGCIAITDTDLMSDVINRGNAVFIVRACNAHYALMAALEQCRSELSCLHHGDGDMEHAEKHSAGLRMANAALNFGEAQS